MRALGVALLLLAGACSADRSAPPPPRATDLGGEIVARVGDEGISASTVARIAAAQQVSLETARDRAVSDALFAAEARSRGLADAGSRAALDARALFEQLRAEEAGPVTDEELEEVTQRHWFELRRPPSKRIVHAVALVPPRKADKPGLWADSEAIAETVRGAVDEASSLARLAPMEPGKDPAAEAFRKAASAVERRGLELRAEVLEPVTAEGRTVGRGGGTLSPEFMSGIASLRGRGDIVGPFRTTFGFHVAMLLEEVPGFEMPKEERRAQVRAEVVDGRLRRRRAQLLEGGASTVEVSSNAPALLDLVRVQ